MIYLQHLSGKQSARLPFLCAGRRSPCTGTRLSSSGRYRCKCKGYYQNTLYFYRRNEVISANKYYFFASRLQRERHELTFATRTPMSKKVLLCLRQGNNYSIGMRSPPLLTARDDAGTGAPALSQFHRELPSRTRQWDGGNQMCDGGGTEKRKENEARKREI